MEITKREIIASVSIFCVMLVIGFLISHRISEKQMDKNATYNKAVEVNNQEMFEYGMNTNIGNAFVSGDLIAIDGVSFDGLEDKYLHAKRVKERYTMHTRTVTTTNSDGTTSTRTETYWSWDTVETKRIQSKKVEFCGVEFNSSQFRFPSASYIQTIKVSSNVRYKYYGYPVKSKGTIFSQLKDKNIEDENVVFYKDLDIKETRDQLTSEWGIVVFWVTWIILIVLSIVGFYYLENEWLY